MWGCGGEIPSKRDEDANRENKYKINPKKRPTWAWLKLCFDSNFIPDQFRSPNERQIRNLDPSPPPARPRVSLFCHSGWVGKRDPGNEVGTRLALGILIIKLYVKL